MKVLDILKILAKMQPEADVFIKNVTGDPYNVGVRSVVVSHNGSVVTLING